MALCFVCGFDLVFSGVWVRVVLVMFIVVLV